jgi:uncharacterized protein YegL
MKKRQILFWIIFLFPIFISLSSPAQKNLICNPGFEDGSKSDANIFSDNRTKGNTFIKGWTHPGKGCPDYWTTTGVLFPDEDFNSLSYSPLAPHSGNGIVGLALYVAPYMDHDWDDFMDYMQTKLKHPLIKDSSYYLEFYVKLDESSSFVINNIGALFTTTEVQADRSRIDRTPQIFLTTDSILSDSDWVKISGHFKADDNYQYMTIGTFGFNNIDREYQETHPDDNDYNDKHHLSDFFYMMAYYYMDDFLLLADHPKSEKQSANNVIVLVDVSKSMYDGKYIDTLKDDLKNFITADGGKTKISIITFGSGVQIKSRATFFTDPKAIDSLLSTFENGSSTNIEKALEAGYTLADSLYDPDKQTSVILFSDAGFELSKKAAKKIKSHVKDKHIPFVVYHYGKHENKNLEESVQKWDGIYANAKDQHLNELIKPKETSCEDCDCN